MIPPDRLELVYPDGPPPWDAAPDCAAVCLGGRYTRQAVAAYAGTGIEIVTLVDWPAGLGKPTVRQIEAVAAAKDGTHAIEISAPAELLRQGDAAALAEDLQGIAIAVCEVSRAVQIRVGLNNPGLLDDCTRFAQVCLAVRESGGDAVVLSPRSMEAGVLPEITQYAEPPPVYIRCSTDQAERWLAAGAARVSVVRETTG